METSFANTSVAFGLWLSGFGAGCLFAVWCSRLERTGKWWF